MKRIGVLVLYDQDGVVDESKEYLLVSLQDLLDRFIVIINGDITKEAYQIILKYSKEIIIRPNEGYDGGAYRDFFQNHITFRELQKYDELFLLNDTFYGPFFPWREVFERMEIQQIDFWGLTKHVAFYSDSMQMNITEHIQSYFVVFNKHVFISDYFFEFWQRMKTPHNHNEAVKYYEIQLTSYFTNKGFKYMVYTDLYKHLEYLQQKENTYINHCYDLLKDCRLPILKKLGPMSCFSTQTVKAIKYIQEQYHYNINALWENARRTVQYVRSFNAVDILHEKHSCIVVYGCGQVSQIVENYFNYKNWRIDGYIETIPKVKEKNGKPVYAWRDFQMDEHTGIIVALGKKNMEEVRSFLPSNEHFVFLR